MKTSAPGKLLLFGDHAVVYGYPSIVTALSARLRVTAGISSGDTRFLQAAITRWGKPGVSLVATSEFSGTYGLGSSSAVTVAALKWLKPDATGEALFETAYAIVREIQGVGSGFDVAAAVYGGTLYYIQEQAIEPIVTGTFPLIVGYSGVKADTVSMIKEVEKKSGMTKRIFEGIAKIVDEAKVRFAEGDWERVGKLMDFNQEYLRDIGVSTEKLEALIKAAKDAGAWGAKLSGAGGGDCMIAMGPEEKRSDIQQAIIRAGGEVVDVTPAAEGVRVEA